MKTTIIQHHGNTYEITVKFGADQVKINVNGVSCGRVQFCCKHVYAVLLPQSEGRLMILLYHRKIYLFDIEPGTDIVTFAKDKAKVNISIVSKVITTLSFISFLISTAWFMSTYNIKEIAFWHEIIALVLFLGILYPTAFFSRHPMISNRRKKVIFFIGFYLAMAVSLLYSFTILRLFG